ncbi:MAG: hypothetical protein ACRYG4_19845 [Janthinobacterium lividum]
MIDQTRALFGRSYAAEPDQLIEELRAGKAIAAADTLLLTVPNQLDDGVTALTQLGLIRAA